MLARAILSGVRGRGIAWATGMGLAGVGARDIECFVDHIYIDGSSLRLRWVISVAEAIPRRMTGRGISVVFGLSRKRSTYMIVLSRWNAIVWGCFIVALWVAR